MNCLMKFYSRIVRRPETAPSSANMSGETALDSNRVQIERKVFFFDMKENASGRFLRITEEVGGRRDTIIVPATGLQAFRDAIDRLIRAERRTSGR
ncbi:MAG: DNA-binding protein [Kiritimatiellia bacterium]|nr:DNA-binding protein [Lentisphaerota bacterium]